MPPHIERITHYVDAEPYAAFIRRLRDILAEHDDIPRQHVRDRRGSIHHVLPKQNYSKEPRRWIYIKLVLCDDGAETTLAVRDDNVYLIGFKNKRGELFEFGFSGTIGPREKSWPMLEGSRFLECDVNYGSLLHGGARSFVGVPLGREFARFAVRRLSGYAQVGQRGKVDKGTRLALAGLMVMICEATRMRPLLERACWHHADCRCIDSNHVDYIWGWGDMSEALLRWQRDPDNFQFPECLKDIGVGGAGKALNIVELLLNTPIHRPPRWRSDPRRRQVLCRLRYCSAGALQSPPSPVRLAVACRTKRRRTEQQHDQQDQAQEQQPPPPPDKGSGESQHSHHQEEILVSPADDDYVARGRPLVEVFAVRAGFHFVGTIAVFDGMRGQVIFENNGGAPPIHGSSSSSGYPPLLLTGPYRAISAYGNFTIEVDISGAVTAAQQDQGAGPSSRDVGELNWDCYGESKVYNKPLTETITTSRSRRKVEVTYAVLRDAVDAELKVHLPNWKSTFATADGRGAVVYGRIATRSKAFRDEDLAWSVLFDSEVEGVSLVADGSGSIAQLPLARSVVAMPLDSPLVIKATLYDAPPSQHGVKPVFEFLDMELTLDDGMRRRSADNGGEFEVSITSPDYYPRPWPNDPATPRRTSINHYGCS